MDPIVATAPKPFVFVLMPFSKEFNDVYKLGIKAACKNAGAYAERVDEQIFDESILERVYNQIAKADIIIADMTGRNPNVFYEVGYAHALGKLVILLTQNTDDIPFDLKHYPHIVYGEEIADKLLPELEKRIRWAIVRISEPDLKIRDTLEYYFQNSNLLDAPTFEVMMAEVNNGYTANIYISVYNSPNKVRRRVLPTYSLISTDSDLIFPELSSVQLPDGTYLYKLDYLETLNPGSADKLRFRMLYKVAEESEAIYGKEVEIIFREYVGDDFRDIPIKIRFVEFGE
jgi:hypothetical protein